MVQKLPIAIGKRGKFDVFSATSKKKPRSGITTLNGPSPFCVTDVFCQRPLSLNIGTKTNTK